MKKKIEKKSIKDKFFTLNNKKIMSILLIIIAMYFAFFLRSGPISLDGLDNRIEANTYSQIQNLISQQVELQYPNLNEINKADLINKEYQKVIKTGIYTFNGEEIKISEIVEQNSKNIKNQFKAENGQTYLNAIDPYLFLRYTENYINYGHKGDEIKLKDDGKESSFASYRLAPVGTEVGKLSFHDRLEIFLMKINGINSKSNIGEKTNAIFLLPVFLVMLSVIPSYLIIREYSNDIFAFLGTLILISIGTFVSRTIAGFVDTDAYNVLFPLLIIAPIIYSFKSDKINILVIFTILAAIFQVLFLWAWGQAWFIFLFIITSLISILGYKILKKLFNKNKKKIELKKLLILIFGFIISSEILSLIFLKKEIFSTMTKGITNSISGIGSISQTNIWPNVYSSVAELNPASFAQIISSVGGKLIFLIAMIGIVLLTISNKTKNNKFNLYNKVLIGVSLIWFYLIVFNNLFVTFTANSKLLFLILIFLPVGIGLLLSLFNENNENNIFLSILLSIWVAGTIYMSLNGVRFILLLAPAFAIAFGIGMYKICNFINQIISKEIKTDSKFARNIFGYLIIGVIFLVIYIPMFTQANVISKGTTPNFDDAWYEAMYKIENESDEDAIITSWWDFGHFFAAISNRGVTFDGGSQTTPRAHWVGKLLLENDEQKAHDILRMLVCGGNEAHNTMLNFTTGNAADAVKINKIIYSTFGKNTSTTKEIITNNKYYNYTNEQINEIIELLACENPRENFVITSGDMIGKAGVWAHWGSWDFTKKYVHDNYKKLDSKTISNNIDENESLIIKYIEELKEIDTKANLENIKREDLINSWFAPYPSYVPLDRSRYEYPCQFTNTTIICENGLEIDMFNSKVSGQLTQHLTFKTLNYPNNLGELTTLTLNESGEFDIVLTPGQNGFNSLITQSPLGASLFTKLFYLDGIGTNLFEKFDDKQSATGIRIKTWKTKWNKDEETSLKVGSVSFNTTSEDLDKIVDTKILENISSN